MQTPDGREVVLEAKGVTKRFGAVIADNSVDFQLLKGEIHALLGENGAGKTTLCSLLYGYFRPDEGEVWVKGRQARFSSPKDAIRAGIGMVHQELMLIPNMMVVENLSLILDTDVRRPNVDLQGVRKKLLRMEEAYGLPVDPEAVIENLSVGERQRVEILKCLFVGADILLLDEPTSFLTEIETEKLFESLKKMVREGRSVVFVTHKIDEVMAIADRITVLKQGRVVATRGRGEVTRDDLAKLIVGREVMYNVKKADVSIGGPLLRLTDVWCDGDTGVPAVKGATFEIRSGEILCIAGVAGNGQRELDEVITGMRRATKGRVELDGREITNLSPDEIRRAGVAHICEEHKTGFVFSFSLKDNLILSPFLAEKFRKGLFLDEGSLREKTRELIREYGIVAESEDAPLSSLSGGNKQKFLLARELFWDPKVIVANNPTKGLDIAAAEHIRATLMKEKERGKAILMISSDLDEVLDMSDRIAVLYEGSVVRVVEASRADLHELAYYMTTGTGLKATA